MGPFGKFRLPHVGLLIAYRAMPRPRHDSPCPTPTPASGSVGGSACRGECSCVLSALRRLWRSFGDRGTARIVRLIVCRRSADQSLSLGHLSQPVQLRRKLGIAFKPCTECSDVDLALAAIVPFRFIEVLRAGVDWSASREVLIFQ